MSDSGSEGRAGRSHHPVAGQAAAPQDEELQSRRLAVAELGDALRELVELAAATEVPGDVLSRVASQVREAAIPLARRTRTRTDLPSADDLLGGYRMYNPVTGSGSGLAPPLYIQMTASEAIGTCTLGLAYEGPPTFAHGGVSAMLLDQLMGYATSAAGHPGMTVKLEVRYRAPVPLQAPLRLSATVAEVHGRRVTVQGVITTAAEPDRILVEATGLFVSLRTDQAASMFARLRPGTADPRVAHD